MKKEYVTITRKNSRFTTLVPKQFQSGKIFTFLVNKKFAKRFPKRGISFQAIHMADFIFVDGFLIKNVYGPAFTSRFE